MANNTQNAAATYQQAVTYQNNNQINEAIALMQNLVDTELNASDTYLCFLGSLYAQDDQLQNAKRYLRAAIKKNKHFADAYFLLGNVELTLSNVDKALQHYINAKTYQYPDEQKLMVGMLNAYERLGNCEKVRKLTTECINQGMIDIHILVIRSLCCKDNDSIKAAIEDIIDYINNHELVIDSKVNSYFTLGHLHDKIQNYESAFHYYALGNNLKDAFFDAFDDNQQAQRLTEIVSRPFLDNIPHAKKISKKDIRPLFIVGFPRSGTSLLERILDSHSAIFGAGESAEVNNIISAITAKYPNTPYPQCLVSLSSDDINKYARSYMKTLEPANTKGLKYIINKTPSNYLNVGLIEILFPNAIILHCSRNPIDTCLSCYFQNFSHPQPHTYKLNNLASSYTNYKRIIQHWKNTSTLKIVDVQYNDVISNTEETIKNIIEILNLKWEKSCLQYHRKKKLVKTASYVQANQKIYNTSIERWKNYADFIKDSKLLDLIK